MANLFADYIASKDRPIDVRDAIIDRTTTEGMTSEAMRNLKAAVNAAKAAGLSRIDVRAAKGGGHKSHAAGTEWDIVGYNADGSRWTNAQRVAVAEGARQVGADRFGIYNMEEGLGKGTLHIGQSGKGRPAAVWGAKGYTEGDISRKFTDPAEIAFMDSVLNQKALDTAKLFGFDRMPSPPEEIASSAPIPRKNPIQTIGPTGEIREALLQNNIPLDEPFFTSDNGKMITVPGLGRTFSVVSAAKPKFPTEEEITRSLIQNNIPLDEPYFTQDNGRTITVPGLGRTFPVKSELAQNTLTRSDILADPRYANDLGILGDDLPNQPWEKPTTNYPTPEAAREPIMAPTEWGDFQRDLQAGKVGWSGLPKSWRDTLTSRLGPNAEAEYERARVTESPSAVSLPTGLAPEQKVVADRYKGLAGLGAKSSAAVPRPSTFLSPAEKNQLRSTLAKPPALTDDVSLDSNIHAATHGVDYTIFDEVDSMLWDKNRAAAAPMGLGAAQAPIPRMNPLGTQVATAPLPRPRPMIATAAKSKYTYDPTVEEEQRELARRGFYTGRIDGLAGPLTMAARAAASRVGSDRGLGAGNSSRSSSGSKSSGLKSAFARQDASRSMSDRMRDSRL